MTTVNINSRLFLAALKDVVRKHPEYFYVTAPLDEIDSMWDLQPQYSKLESLLLEDRGTQQFIASVWSFFRPLNLGESALAEMTRCMSPWQKAMIAQLIVHDPINNSGSNSQIPDLDISRD